MGLLASVGEIKEGFTLVDYYQYQVFEKLVAFTVILTPIYVMIPHISC